MKTGARILYLEPTTEKLADGVYCIGGYSIADTTVIEAEDGLIVYDTGDTKEEAEHIRELNAQNGLPTTVAEHIAMAQSLGGLAPIGGPKTDNIYHPAWVWAGERLILDFIELENTC